MDWKAHVRSALGENGRSPDEDVVEELAQHTAAAYEAARSDGCSADEALNQVNALLAHWRREAVLLGARPRRRSLAEVPSMDSGALTGLFHDIRYGLRLLRREPGYSIVAILTIALGIAATTTLFSVMYGVLLKPLPWPEPDRLVRFEERRGGQTGRIPWTIGNGTYLAWRESASATIEELGGWISVPSTLRGAGEPERLRISRVTSGMFTVLRARPALGRLFVADDAASSQAGTAILSHGFWQRRFGGVAEVVGRTIQLDDIGYTVIGVMPPEFVFPDRETQVWIPAHMPPVLSEGGKRTSLTIFAAMGRMRPGVTIEQVAAEGTSRARAAPDLGPAALALFGSTGSVTITAAPALDVVISEVRPAIRVLFAAVILVLATSVASVTTIQLARATKRRREMTVRATLGAGTARLARLWLVESSLVGVTGGVAGMLGAAMLLRVLPAILPSDFPRMADVTLDWRVASFATAVTLFASVVCGLVPGLQTRRVDLVESLKEGGSAPAGGLMRTKASRTRAVIMGGQIAIACVLLVGAGLLGRSLIALIHADRGYDPSNLLTARLPLPARTTFVQSGPTLERLRDRLRGIPGVTTAAFGNALPLVAAGGMSGFHAAKIQIQSLHRTVSPDYFAALRLRLLAGRLLSETDTATSQPVLVVNRSFAARYLGEKPVGQRLAFRMWGRSDWEVVGVVDDMKQDGFEIAGFTKTSEASQPEMFSSYRQVGQMSPVTVILAVRTSVDPSFLAPALRTLIREEAPSLVLDSVMTMDDRVMSSLAKPRTYAFVLASFALFALTIAAVGLFGVLSYNVAQRTREIGVRTALGARTADIVSLVLRQAMVITIGGLAAGLMVAGLFAQSLSKILYGVRPYDAATFVLVPLVLAAVAAAACAAPARRAARVDPLRALRSE